MAEFIDPAIVPKVTLPSGEKVPCMGMGTFGSDRVSAEDVSAAVAGAIRSGYRMFACQHTDLINIWFNQCRTCFDAHFKKFATGIKDHRFAKLLLMKVL